MNGKCRTQLRYVFVALAFAGSLPNLQAEDDVSPLSLVRDSAALCLEVPRIDETRLRFLKSQFAARIKKFPPVERLLSGSSYANWAGIEEHSRRVTGRSISEHLARAFSESVVVAVYLPENQKPQGILIGKASSEDALKQALQAWTMLDPSHVAHVREHHGQPYIRRAKSAKSSEVIYYATFGQIFVVSDHESLVQAAIDDRATAIRKLSGTDSISQTVRTLGESSLYRTNRERLPKDVSAFLFVHIRAWEKALEKEIQQSPDAAMIRKALQCVTALGLSVHLGNEAVFNVVAEISPESRTTSWQQFVAGTKRTAGWTQQIPSNAILAMSGHFPARPLIETWLTIFPNANTTDFLRGRSALNSALQGKDFFVEVLPALLRDWTIAVSLAEDAPVEIQGQFSIAGETSTDRTLADSLDNALHFAMNLFALHNSAQNADPENPLTSRSTSTDGGLVRSLAGLRGWSPSYQLGSEQLTVTSSLNAIMKLQTAAPSTSARFASVERRHFPAATQVIWLDAARLRIFASRHGGWLSGVMAPHSDEERERVQGHLTRIHEVTKLIDAAFIAARFDVDHAHVLIGVSVDD